MTYYRKRRESSLEQRCVRWARARGVQVGKLSECAGLPDRIFFVPGGKPLVPEFKDPKGRTAKGRAALQKWHRDQLAKQGYAAPLLDTKEKFLAAMAKKGVR